MIKVAIVGVGNCASALVQGNTYYRTNAAAPGLIHNEVMGYKAGDLEFVAAFDVDRRKVGLPLREAIFAGENNTLRFAGDVLSADVIVVAAPLLDGVGSHYAERVHLVGADAALVDDVLGASRPDVLVNYLPVGSDEATRFWAQKCLEHRIAFVNAIPSFIVSKADWATKFLSAGVPCAGDDVKSQIGATMVHRALAHVFSSRGGSVDSSYQLNIGGNMDFLNMCDQERLASKRISKTGAIRHEIAGQNSALHVAPSDYVPHLMDQKIAFINLQGTAFGGAPVEIECRLKVWDSPNSAAVVMDVIRFCAHARKIAQGGPIEHCSYYFKAPPIQIGDAIAGLRAGDAARDGGTRQPPS